MASATEGDGDALPAEARGEQHLGWRAWGAVWGVLAFLALLAASRLALGQARVPLGDALTTGLLDWLLWGPVLAGVPFLVRAAPLERERLGRALLAGRRSRAEALRRAELDRRLSETRLEVLRAQLEPHFLFNTLNAITASIRSDPDRAENMLVSLADLLRASLASRDRHELPLREELEILEGYLAIQRARFGSRLTVTVDVEPEVLDARLPSFLLQPLVENALQHGIAARPGPGTVEVRAWRANGRLELRVRDDGPGLDDAHDTRPGLGLGNTRDRLRLLYGDAQRLELRSADGTGTEVAVALPYRGSES